METEAWADKPICYNGGCRIRSEESQDKSCETGRSHFALGQVPAVFFGRFPFALAWSGMNTPRQSIATSGPDSEFDAASGGFGLFLFFSHLPARLAERPESQQQMEHPLQMISPWYQAGRDTQQARMRLCHPNPNPIALRAETDRPEH